MYAVAICDDNRGFELYLEETVEKILPGADITGFNSAADLREWLGSGDSFDIVITDTRLQGEDCIALVGELFPEGCGTQVIYVTEYLRYCTKVYDTSHIAFLVKPLDEEELRKALSRAVVNLRRRDAARLAISFGGSLRLIDPADIIYVESDRRKLHIHTRDGCLDTYMTIAQLARNAGGRLLLCHKSYAVNPDAVVSLSPAGFEMSDGSVVPISRQKYAAVKSAFAANIQRKP